MHEAKTVARRREGPDGQGGPHGNNRPAGGRYLAEREDAEGAPVFVGRFDHLMNTESLRQLSASLGEKIVLLVCHARLGCRSALLRMKDCRGCLSK